MAQFKFSIVLAVYNVEDFVAEAIESILQQDLGFKENVQLILVDDGSTDKSGAICDSYSKKFPDNISVIHKANGGVGSARNAGLKCAEGRYLNFMDSDDKLSKNALSEVYKFFINHEEETDVVAIPMKLFDRAHGSHWLNYKFTKGSRVIDLYKEYDALMFSASSGFFRTCCMKNVTFDTRLVGGEDVKAVLTILHKKVKLGVVSTCQYFYRKRRGGEFSLTQSYGRKYGWYFDFFTYFIDWALDFYRDKLGFVPAYVQYLIVADLHWRIVNNNDGSRILDEDEREAYKQRLFGVYRNIDDRYILEQSRLGITHKIFVLSKKYNTSPSITKLDEDFVIHFGETAVCQLSEFSSVRLEFLKYKKNTLTIEGFTKYPSTELGERLGVYALVNNQKINCELIQREKLSTICFGEIINNGVGFKVDIPIENTSKNYEIRFGITFRGVEIVSKKLLLGQFFPVATKPVNSYFYCNGSLLSAEGNSLKLSRCTKFSAAMKELSLLTELLRTKDVAAKKAFASRCFYHLAKQFRRNEVWLISDHINKADDNGEALFEYISKNGLPVSTYFVLRSDSPDYPSMKKRGKVLDYNSVKHKLINLLANKIVSSSEDNHVFNPYGNSENYYRDILCRQTKIFIQHGILSTDLSKKLNKYNKNFSTFITSTKKEHDSIINGDYYYDQCVVKLTGLARFDRLYDQRLKIISIMPTWRTYLGYNGTYRNDGIIRYDKDFVESEFFMFYNSLLNDAKLLGVAKKYGYQIKFLPHPNLADAVRWFIRNDTVTLCSLTDKYRDVFAESSLLVTDYSSVAFDFAYLRKPVVYCQFDKETLIRNSVYTPSYFDEEKDGFGEVETNLENTVDRIIEYMENGCTLKPIYHGRIDQFFTFKDKNNCQRNYEAIKSSDC